MNLLPRSSLKPSCAGKWARSGIRFLLLLVAGMVAGPPAAGADRIMLRNVTARSGVDFIHTDGSSGKRYIVETVASGLATFDYNHDGLTDIYFVNGAPLRGTETDTPATNRLYRNTGDFRFVDVTGEAGVGDRGYGLAVAVADYDNDGHDDIYLGNYGPNVMYRNRGNGTFEDVAEAVGTRADIPGKVGAGVAFLDIDGDGDLDLFVANYLEFSYEHPAANFWHGVAIYPGPEQYPALPAMLYENQGNGRFRDVSRQLTVDSPWGRGMGIVAADYDDDGDTDVFVGNDGRPGNFLFQNDGRGRFTETGGLSGVAFTAAGNIHGSMGVDCNDYDNDSHLDF
ncbi:MAG: FG-GAP repeat domain-containing protein, partial [Thermoguttaceae bacterium]